MCLRLWIGLLLLVSMLITGASSQQPCGCRTTRSMLTRGPNGCGCPGRPVVTQTPAPVTQRRTLATAGPGRMCRCRMTARPIPPLTCPCQTTAQPTTTTALATTAAPVTTCPCAISPIPRLCPCIPRTPCCRCCPVCCLRIRIRELEPLLRFLGRACGCPPRPTRPPTTTTAVTTIPMTTMTTTTTTRPTSIPGVMTTITMPPTTRSTVMPMTMPTMTTVPPVMTTSTTTLATMSTRFIPTRTFTQNTTSTGMTMNTTTNATSTTSTTEGVPGTVCVELEAPACDEGWEAFMGNCYLLVQRDREGFDAGEADCENRGAFITSVHSEAENTFLVMYARMMNVFVFYIGLRAEPGSMDYLFFNDDTAVDYTNWAPEEPNQENGCVQVYGENSGPNAMSGMRWNDVNCNITHPVICKKPPNEGNIICGLPETRPTPTSPTISTATMCAFVEQPDTMPCDPRWAYFNMTMSCYVSVRNPNWDWYDYERACENTQATLTSVHSDEENTFIQNLTGTMLPYWIGLRNTSGEPTTFNMFEDGSRLDYSRWWEGQPAPQNGQACVEVIPRFDAMQNRTIIRWETGNCNSTGVGGVCKKPRNPAPPPMRVCGPGSENLMNTVQTTMSTPPSTRCMPSTTASPPVCPGGWALLQASNKCFIVLTRADTMMGQESQCMNLMGNLAAIHNQRENSFIANLVQMASASPAWIGLTAATGNRLHETWTDGTRLDFTMWNNGQPNGDTMMTNCVQMDAPGGGWDEVPCNSTLAGVCQRVASTMPSGCP